MQQMQEPPQGVGAIRSRRRPPRRRAAVTLPDPSSEDLQTLLVSHQDAVAAQIEHGVRALHHTAVRLMNQLADASQGVSAEDAGRSLLTHVDERYQALSLRMDRVEGALRKLVQTLKHGLRSPGGGEVAGRLEGLARTVQQVATQQRAELEAFTRQMGHGLARVAARTGEGLAQVAQRQEAMLDSRLEEMRQAIDALNGESASADDAADHDSGERAVAAFDERLRAAEDRVATVPEELTAWDPFEERPADGPA